MVRPALLLVALVSLVAPLAACGGGDDEPESTPEFDAAYEPVNQGILEFASESIDSLPAQGQRVTEQAAGQLGELAKEARDLAGEVAQLEPPEDLTEAAQTVETNLEATADGLDEVATAARNGDQQAATAALQQLAPVGQELNGAQDFLADATGTPTGQEE
jgi:TolA-binding protein